MDIHSSSVPTWFNTSYVQKNLREGLQDPTLKVEGIDVASASSAGGNYCAQVLRVKVDIKNWNTKEELSMIVKMKPETLFLELMTKEMDLFDIEEKFFSIFLPEFNEIIKTIKNVGKLIPKCYFVDTEKHVICMEDMVAKGFELRQEPSLTIEQAEIAVDALAVFHGVSYKILQTSHELTKIFGKGAWGSDLKTPLYMLVKNASLAVKMHIDSYNLEDKYKKKLLVFLDDIDAGKLAVSDLEEGKLNFLLHGDCWMNNMLFKNENGTPTGVRLIDFQIVNYNSFANDLQYFITTSLSSDMIVSMTEHLLTRYYTKLADVAPEIPRLTLERIKIEYFERTFMSYVLGVVLRSFVVQPDLDKIFQGKGVDDAGFIHPNYVDYLQKVMPYLEEHGLLND